jgi:arginine exporter protein ArgO
MPLLAELAAGAVAGLAVAMPVGAVGAYLLGLGARSPGRTAAAAALGVASVDGAYALVASLGGLGLRHRVEAGGPGLTLAAALVLVLVAVRTGWSAAGRFRRPPDAAGPAPLSPGRAYTLLVAMTAVNPATLVTFTAVVLARSGSGGSSAAAALFAAGAFSASAAWQLLLAGGGSLLGRVLSGPRGQLGVGLASSAIMLALAAALLLG